MTEMSRKKYFQADLTQADSTVLRKIQVYEQLQLLAAAHALLYWQFTASTKA